MSNSNQNNNPRIDPPLDQEDPPQIVGPRPFISGQWPGYLVCIMICTTLAFIVIQTYPQKYHKYQVNQDRYAAERAIDSLAIGNIQAAKEEVEKLSSERPIYIGGMFNRQFSLVWEGTVLRNRVNIYERLAAALLENDLLDEAEVICWKAIYEYHIHSRGLEVLVPWELMLHIQTLLGNWQSVWGCARILAAHGVDQIRQPPEMHPEPFRLDKAELSDGDKNLPREVMLQLKRHGEAIKPREFYIPARIFVNHVNHKMIPDPGIQRRLVNLAHLSLIQADRRDEARALFTQITGYDPSFNDQFWLRWPWVYRLNLLNRDPTTLEMLWHERPENCRLQAKHFLNSFKNDGRITNMQFKDVNIRQNGYFNKKNLFIQEKDEDKLHLFQNVMVSMTLQVDRPVYQVCIAYEATPVLGVYPILLMQINDGSPYPLYMEPKSRDIAVDDLGKIFPNQDLMTVDVNLDPGTHEFSWTFINDFGFTWDKTDNNGSKVYENRDVLLHRLALIHVTPSY